MFEIDRITAIVKPKSAFLDWLKTYSEEYYEFTIEDLTNDCTALLIPVVESPEEAQDYIESMHQTITRNELDLLDIDQTSWPKTIDQALFDDWFEIEFHSMVFDTTLTEQDLEDTDYEDDDDDDDYDDGLIDEVELTADEQEEKAN